MEATKLKKLKKEIKNEIINERKNVKWIMLEMMYDSLKSLLTYKQKNDYELLKNLVYDKNVNY